MYARNVNMQMLSVFNYDRKLKRYYVHAKTTKANENAYCVLPLLCVKQNVLPMCW